jgi:Tol biopolymer transport system component
MRINTYVRVLLLLTTAILLSSCDRLLDFFHPGGGSVIRPVQKIYFAADSEDTRRMSPLPVYDPQSREIFSINPDGTGLKQLTRNKSSDEQPAVSPDGKWLVFVSTSRVPTFAPTGLDLFQIRSDGSDEKWLIWLNSNEDDYSPAISNDGQFIAFISKRDGNPEVYVGDINASYVFRVTKTDSASEVSPAWSPDGKWLVFIRETKGLPDAKSDLWMIPNPTLPHVALAGWPLEINVTDSVRNHNRQNYNLYNHWEDPDWSPDSKALAVSAHYLGPLGIYVPPAIFTINPFTYSIGKLCSDSLSSTRLPQYDPSWSPDGKYIICSSANGSPNQLDIYDLNGILKNSIVPKQNIRYFQPDWGKFVPLSVAAE